MFCMSGTAAAAAAKLLQLCPTLCDPIDGSHYCFFKNFFWWCRITCGILILPPGTKPSPPALEAQCLCHWLSHFSRIWLFVTLWTVACQAPLSIRFFRQEYWSGLPCPPPSIFLTQGSNPHLSCLLQWFSGKSSFYCFKKHHFGCCIEDWLGQNEASHQRAFSLSRSQQVVWLLLFSFLLFLFCFVSSPFCFTILGPGFRTERLQMAWVLEQRNRGTGGPESCHMSHKSSFQSRSYLPGRMSSSWVRGAAARRGSEHCQNTINKTIRFLQR